MPERLVLGYPVTPNGEDLGITGTGSEWVSQLETAGISLGAPGSGPD